MKQQAVNHLNNVILPFWNGLKTDKGFIGHVDYELNKDEKAGKGVILNSRILWFYSSAYIYTKNAIALENAHHAYNFLTTYCVDKEYGGVYWMVDSEGNPIDDNKHSYNQAFAVYALSAYYEATNDNNALELAFKIYSCIEEKCKDTLGYKEAFDRYWQPVENEKLADSPDFIDREIKPAKTMNTILHLLEAYTEFYKVTNDKKVGERLKNLLDIIYKYIYDEPAAQLNVFFDEKYNVLGEAQSYGHDIEAAWLIDRACEVFKDEEICKKFASINTKIVDAVIDRGFDNQALYEGIAFGKVNKSRVWWIQAEAVVGLLNEYQKTADIKYLNTANKIFDYILEYVVDKRAGSEWLWLLNEDNTPNVQPIVEEWKCPYHNGRMVIEILRRNINV